MQKKYYIIIFFHTALHGHRSLLRPDMQLPMITVNWVADSQCHELADSHLQAYTFFKIFDKDYFLKHTLPYGNITYRYDKQKSVSSTILNNIIEHLIVELRQKRKRFTHFDIIKGRDFNSRSFAGCLILKFKEYPFILKLFIENPRSFVEPFTKGFEPGCFFNMGGGINRHLTGFTRIKNVQTTQQLASRSSEWKNIISFPRKWYWIAKDCQWIEITGKRMGDGSIPLHTRIPAIYGIIADEIHAEKKRGIFHREHRKRCMKFCNYIGYRIDPHLQNFIIEKETEKLVVIDTEDFRSLVGLTKKMHADTYTSWYLQLASKCIKDSFFRNKQERLAAQQDDTWKSY